MDRLVTDAFLSRIRPCLLRVSVSRLSGRGRDDERIVTGVKQYRCGLWWRLEPDRRQTGHDAACHMTRHNVHDACVKCSTGALIYWSCYVIAL